MSINKSKFYIVDDTDVHTYYPHIRNFNLTLQQSHNASHRAPDYGRHTYTAINSH